MLEAINEAVGAHLVQDLPGGKERYQFSHALIQQTLVGEWTASRRVRLHARIGAALEELYGEEVEAHSAELAYHYTAAEPVVGPAKLVRYSMLAGERALATYAYEEALNHYRRALAARGIDPGSSEPAQDAEAAALLFGLGCAQGAFVTRDMGQQAIDMLGRAHPPGSSAVSSAVSSPAGFSSAELPTNTPSDVVVAVGVSRGSSAAQQPTLRLRPAGRSGLLGGHCWCWFSQKGAFDPFDNRKKSLVHKQRETKAHPRKWPMDWLPIKCSSSLEDSCTPVEIDLP